MNAPQWPVTRSRRIGFTPPPVKAPVQASIPAPANGKVHPAPIVIPPRRKAVQPPAPVAATPLAARTPPPVLPLSPVADEGAAKAPRIAPTAIRDAADTRIAQLRGQIGQDCAALANTALAIGRRIAAGETPRQEGEFMVIARRLDQDCASLYECLRLTKCY